MTTTLKIELPDNLINQLDISSGPLEKPLQRLVLKSLQAIADLTKLLNDADPDTRIKAVHMLAGRGEEAIPTICRVLNDDDLVVQQSAVQALEKIGTAEAIQILSKHPFVRFDESTEAVIFDPLSALVGSLQADVSDLAENHDQYIAEALKQELSLK